MYMPMSEEKIKQFILNAIPDSTVIIEDLKEKNKTLENINAILKKEKKDDKD